MKTVWYMTSVGKKNIGGREKFLSGDEIRGGKAHLMIMYVNASRLNVQEQ